MTLLFKHFYDGDVDKFRSLLAVPGHNAQTTSRSSILGGGGGGVGGGAGAGAGAGAGTGAGGGMSPGGLSTSPRNMTKTRKASSGWGLGFGAAKHGSPGLGRAEINARDHAGLTLLLRAASSTADNAIEFVRLLLDHPATDIYAQDPESGWNCLHRALYAGNISVARLLLERERSILTGQTLGASVGKVGRLIKTKDHEGNSPFDLFNSTIGERTLGSLEEQDCSDDESEGEEVTVFQDDATGPTSLQTSRDGDELFAFGSNRNLSLGFGDEDDRQFPERVVLRRPERLLRRFYDEYLEDAGLAEPASFDVSGVPTQVANRPLLVHDVVLSKFHSAVLTTDPVSNLYVCGVGRGGRLGLGDENTRFNYVPVQAGLADRKVVRVALGQNHSMAITESGELWTWGSNSNCQLGYALPAPAKADEEPCGTTPRQVFGPLKKEVVVGVAASAIHSVAHTGTSLYCWGRNVGQLALMDSDSRSLEVQPAPRKVAASLISSPVVMVSAIDRATTCLLANHTVVCFTSYGYSVVKFPFAESFANYHMSSRAFVSARHEASRNQIQYVTSSGDTIAAVTGRGDLFTFGLQHKADPNATATSTTNPSKIRGAVTQPQCIWHARREGVRSVGVGEHGSVIISTESGAVWRRIKRAKAKDAYAGGSSEVKRKDFKFQRVPYITKVVSVRASPSGTFAAVRRDADVMAKQIQVGGQRLWEDVAPLNPLAGFVSSDAGPGDGDVVAGFRDADALRDRLGPIPYEVLKSPDLDGDLRRHLTTRPYRSDHLAAAVCTSTCPDVRIPIHGWVLASRSPVLRAAMASYRRRGSHEHANEFCIDRVDGTDVVTFSGLDLVSVLNLVHYMYADGVIPAWNFTRQAPSLAHRFRQIRAELMKIATRLDMPKLETAVRIQTDPKKSLAADLGLAVRERSFFDDADALLELGGAEVPVHSTLLCQRCPWFDGLFHGRSRGMWLAARREKMAPSDRVRIDLTHIDPAIFGYALQHIYADTGEEMFDHVVSDSVEDMVDLVMDVLSVANELMLDRLAQICQKVLGRTVNTRNVACLLNAVSPCSVTEFKDSALEYICLQVESMLENLLLDDLDEGLLLELDRVTRANQLARLPFVRSGRAELLLLDKYPELAQDMEEERQRRARETAFKATQREEERKLSTSLRGRYGSLDDPTMAVPSPDRIRRSARLERNGPFSPDLRPKASNGDLVMFDMDEDAAHVDSPLSKPGRHADGAGLEELSSLPPSPAPGPRRPLPSPSPPSLKDQAQSATRRATGKAQPSATAAAGNPWGHPNLPTAKLGLGEIIKSETTTNRSALSAGLAAQAAKEKETAPSPSKPPQSKLSQKERKKQQMQAAARAAQPAEAVQRPRAAWDRTANDGQAAPPPPWKTAPSKDKAALRGEPAGRASTPAAPAPTAPVSKPLVAVESSAAAGPRRTASPDTRFSGQSRAPSGAGTPARATPAQAAPPRKAPGDAAAPQTPRPLVPHSRLYITPARSAEPVLGLSMADIIGQQQREQELVREAVAKRSLQEIQQEQAFQEWWDAESRRAQEEEARRRRGPDRPADGAAKRPQRGRAGRPKGAAGRGGPAPGSAAAGSGALERSGGKGRVDGGAGEMAAAGGGGSGGGRSRRSRT